MQKKSQYPQKDQWPWKRSQCCGRTSGRGEKPVPAEEPVAAEEEAVPAEDVVVPVIDLVESEDEDDIVILEEWLALRGQKRTAECLEDDDDELALPSQFLRNNVLAQQDKLFDKNKTKKKGEKFEK